MANTALNRTSQFIGTNKSGGNLNLGDVVILDNTNNNGFTTTTTGAISTRGVYVIIEPNGIANNASGMIAGGGWATKVNLNTSATVGQFIKTHTVAGQATPHASPQVEGDFGVVVDISGSATSPVCWLFGSPNGPAAGGGTPGGSNTQVQYNNSGAFGGITGATTNGTALTLIAPVLGTPASGTLTNTTGLPFTTGLVTVPGNICEGRLTTETGVPISTTDRTAQGTLYWTPCSPSGVAIGTGQITLYNGSVLVTKAITEISLALTLTSGKNYDVFVDYNSGTPQLVLSAAWTTDTARADALATQAGIVVKSGTAAYRWVGTIRASGSNVVADSGGIAGTSQTGGQRFVWNAYNQVPRQNTVIDTTDSWSYGTDTVRQANGASGNKVEWVTGSVATLVDVSVLANITVGSNTTKAGKAGVGIDTTSAFSGLVGAAFLGAVTNQIQVLSGKYVGQPGLGYHFASWNEKGASAGASSFLGDDGGDSSQSGLALWMLG